MSYTTIGRIVFTIEALDYTKRVFDQITGSIDTLNDLLQDVVQAAISWSREVMGIYKTVISAIWNVIEAIVNAIASIADSIGGGGMGGIIGAIMSIISAMIQMELAAKQVAIQIMGMFGEMIFGAIDWVVQGITSAIEAVLEFGGQAWNAFMMAGLGAVSFGEELANITLEFEHAFGEVSALAQAFDFIFGGEATDKIEGMRETIIDMASRTIFSVQEITDAMSKFIKVGIEPTTEGFEAAVESILKMSALEDMDLQKAINTVSSIMYAFKLEVTEVERIVDALTGASVISVAEIQNLGTSLSYTAASAHQLGISMEDTLLYVTALTDVFTGMRRGMPGRYMRSLFRSLTEPKADRFLSELGDRLGGVNLRIWDASGALRNFGEWLQAIGPVIRNFSTEQFAIFSDKLGLTIQSQEAFNTLINVAEGRMQDIEKAIRATGITQKMYEDRVNNLADQLKVLRNMLEALWITFSTKWTPVLTDFVKKVREFLYESGLKAWIEDLGSMFSSKLEPFLARIYDLLSNLATGSLGQKIVDIFSRLSDITLDTLGTAIESFLKFITSSEFYNFLNAFATFVEAFIPAYVEGVKSAINIGKELFGGLAQGAKILGEWLGKIMGFAMTIWAAMIPGQWLFNLLNPVFILLPTIIKLLEKAAPMISNVIGKFLEFIDKVFLSSDSISKWGVTLKRVFEGVLVPILHSVGQVFRSLEAPFDENRTRLEALIDAVLEFTSAFSGRFVQNIVQLSDMFIQMATVMNEVTMGVGGLKTQIQLLAEFLADVVPRLVGISFVMLDQVMKSCFGSGIKDMMVGHLPEFAQGCGGGRGEEWWAQQRPEDVMITEGGCGGGRQRPLTPEERDQLELWQRYYWQFQAFEKTISDCSGMAQGAFNIPGRSRGLLGCMGFQHGGIAWKPTLGLVGEKEPELITPLSKLGDIGLGGGLTAHVTIYTGPINTGEDLTMAVERGLDAYTQKMRLRSRRVPT